MEHVKQLLAALSGKLEGLAKANAVVARPVSVADRHLVPLCELGLAFGGGGGTGEMDDASGESGKGTGGGAGGAAKATPVAVLIIEGGEARIELIEQ